MPEVPKSIVAVRDARERAIARLSDAFAHDSLELDEFERRLGLAHRSDSLAEIERLVNDLPGEAPVTALVPATATDLLPAPVAVTVPAHRRERQTMVAVL